MFTGRVGRVLKATCSPLRPFQGVYKRTGFKPLAPFHRGFFTGQPYAPFFGVSVRVGSGLRAGEVSLRGWGDYERGL